MTVQQITLMIWGIAILAVLIHWYFKVKNEGK